MKHLNTRIDKINFLKDLEKGKASVNALKPLIWATETIFEDGTSKAIVYRDGDKREIEGEEVEAFKRQYPDAMRCSVLLCDFSAIPERSNEIRISL